MKFENGWEFLYWSIYNSRNLLMKFELSSDLFEIISTTVEIY